MNGHYAMRWGSRVGSTLLAAAALAWFAASATAAQYGSAVVEQGQMTILREGRPLSFKASPQPIDVNEQDLVRVRDASRIVLKTRDNATLTLGANAVFQCEPWQAPNTSGTFRLLFGRFRAVVSGLAGNEHFAMKTATATIGVKGTEWITATTSTGNTSVLGIEHTVTLAGPDHVEQPVGPNQISTVIAGLPATPSVTATVTVKTSMTNVNSAPVNSPAAQNLPAQNELIEKGIVSKDAVDKSNATAPQTTQQNNPAAPPPPPPTPSINLDDAQQAAGAISGKLHLHFSN